MKILTGEQMARWDRLSIRKHKISARRLMENAARGCCEVLEHLPQWVYQAKVLIACGPGNNGGDGFAMAGMLRKQGLTAEVFFFGELERLSPEARFFYQRVESVEVRTAEGWKKFSRAARDADFLIDALFGTGLKRRLTGSYAKAISLLNGAKGFRLAVDIPSGISAETGEVLGRVRPRMRGKAFRAALTVTFETPKWGQLQPSAWDYVGELKIVPIGLAHSELARFPSSAEYLTEEEVKKVISPRSKALHKGGAGRVLVIAGSETMPGAGYLTSLAALRAGAGLVTWALPEEAFHRLDLRYPEIILDPVPSSKGKFHPKGLAALRKILPKFDAVALGPGWGQGDEVADFLQGLLKLLKRPAVVDADALNLLARSPKMPTSVAGMILTPHPQEMSRLTKISVAELLTRRTRAAQAFAKKHRLWLVLKGYRSVIAGPKAELWINSTGGPNLATAGSGDVLTGILASLLAQGFDRKQAVTAGVCLHGLAGDRLMKRLGDRGTLASDIAAIVPEILREWTA
jgi:NAD(P)H-hydrate epimerase